MGRPPEDGSVTDSKQRGGKSVTLRSARLARNSDGKPLGCGIFLADDDLRALDVDLTDADRVAYRVEGGELRVGESE